MNPRTDTKELQYEGFPLEAVLGRVFTEQGADAAITSADRVRRGGIGGFFAKEVFRVTVAVDARPELTDNETGSASSNDEPRFHRLGSIDLRAEAGTTQGGGTGAAASPLGTRFDSTKQTRPAVAADDVRIAADTIDDRGRVDAHRTDGDRDRDSAIDINGNDDGIDYDEIDPEDIDGAFDLPDPIDRTEEERAIWAMLAEVTRPRAAAATERSGEPAVATTPASSETEDRAADLTEDPEPAATSVERAQPWCPPRISLAPPVATSSPTVAESAPRANVFEPAAFPAASATAGASDDLPSELGTAPRADAPTAVVAEVVTPIRSVGPIASTHVIPTAPGTSVRPPAPFVSPADDTVDTVDSAPSHAASTLAAPIEASVSVLRPLALAPSIARNAAPAPVMGLRTRRTRRSFGPTLDLGELIAEFATAPAAIPAVPPVGIIAVVGVRSEAVDVAGGLALELGIDPDDVVIAAPHAEIEIPTEADTTRLAASARYRCNPIAIVVVELVPGRLGHEWVRAVLDGLRAEQVRFAVSAERLIAQQRLTIAALGGIDAVDITDATTTAFPEEALDVGVPIATIDGYPATPEMWAATVLASHHRSESTVNRRVAGTR